MLQLTILRHPLRRRVNKSDWTEGGSREHLKRAGKGSREGTGSHVFSFYSAELPEEAAVDDRDTLRGSCDRSDRAADASLLPIW